MSRMPFEVISPTSPKPWRGLKFLLLMALTFAVLAFCSILVVR